MTVSTTGIPSTAALGEGIVQWLASAQQPDGNLRDPLTRVALPPDRYGTTLFAAASTLAASGRSATDGALRAVRYYLGLPRSARGTHELNNLGLLRVYRGWQSSGLGPGLRARLAAHLHRMPFASLTTQVTNNWHAMRAVCLAQRSHILGSHSDRRAAWACLRREVLPLQGSSGLFADYPPAGRAGDRMTPLAYHAKFCAMLAMFSLEVEDAAVATALSRGVAATARLCAPNGEALFFGRGCNSVYGYASALYATHHALALGIVPAAERSLVAGAAARMVDYLWKMRCPDGSVRAYPTEFEAERLAWDDYVHRLDYNAFAAFLLLQTPQRAEDAEAPSGSTRQGSAFDFAQDGLLVREQDGTFAAFSTRGQLNTGSYLFADGRYAGMQPLTLQYSGQTIVPPPPHDAEAPTDPGGVGFMPVVVLGGEQYAVRRYEEVRVFDGDGVAIVGQGTPVAYRIGLRRHMTNAARESAGRLVRAFFRRVAPMLRRLPGLVPPAYAVAPARGVRSRRALLLIPGLRCLVLVERIDGDFDKAWTTVRVARPCRPDGDGYSFQLQGVRGRILTARPSAETEVREVFTSNGPAYLVRTPIAPGVPHVSALCFGPRVAFDVDLSTNRRITITAKAAGAVSRIAVDLDALQVAWPDRSPDHRLSVRNSGEPVQPCQPCVGGG